MQEHITEKLSAYLNHELPPAERQTIAEHLLSCQSCRNEHDEIKFGAALAGNLKRSDAPEDLLNEIKIALDKKEKSRFSSVPNFPFFGERGFATASAFLIGFGLVTAFYFGFFRNAAPEIVKTETPVQNANVETAQILSPPSKIAANQNSTAQILPNANSNIQIQTADLIQSNPPQVNRIESENNKNETVVAQKNLPAWNVETIAENQTITEKGKLAVGEFLETDSTSRATIQVANIGQVEIAPNSRVRLVKTNSTEHRLSLTRGILQAKIFAPPRLFIVDTPSAVAVDLGCEYTLEVDAAGNSKLHVTSGFVALERNGRESIVPAGAVCLTKKGKGLGTPFSRESSAELQNALFNFDFQNGGGDSVRTIVKESNVYDALTLWHLLSRTRGNERERVFDRLVSFVKLPAGATKKGVLRLDKKMLDVWWTEIENLWFG